MLCNFISFRCKQCVVAICLLLPGLSAFLWAHYRLNSVIQPPSSLDIDGLRVRQAVIDIGTVWSGGQRLQRDFTLENWTSRAIKIKSVISDCGCTVARADSGEIKAWQSTRIPVVFSPPVAINDQGGRFRRTISVIVDRSNRTDSIPLILTGFVEPDQSLRVSPVNVEFEAPYTTTRPSAILHFKGLMSILTSIPDKLLVLPGSDQRVLVQIPPENQFGAVRTKDVEVVLASGASVNNIGEWNAAITFAPDQFSDGLRIHVRGHVQPSIVASPQSVILTDDPVGREATVRLTSVAGRFPTLELVETALPLTLDYLPESSSSENFRTLRLRLKEPLSVDIAGAIYIRLSSQTAPGETISIPVVILRGGAGHI
jgi:hypothetical protein